MNEFDESVKSLGRSKKYRKGEVLFSAQEKANGFFYVESGEIRVFSYS